MSDGVWAKDGIELRLGDWKDVLGEEVADLILVDPPYQGSKGALILPCRGFRITTTSQALYMTHGTDQHWIHGPAPYTIGLAVELIEQHSAPGQLVVDCYAGLATTLVAARMTGRRCIGAEISEPVFRAAVARLEGS